ncbi:Uncharacterised protein [Sphingobacterium daejeonense]|nr:Uncharacterised protein [Sphingobacterium daejeonense]
MTPITKNIPRIISLEVLISPNSQNEASSLLLKSTIAIKANTTAITMVFWFHNYNI